ncbi:MAG: hypothetical protein R6X29_04370 [Acidimicrobiia bacterium]|jgi:hypothetical protein
MINRLLVLALVIGLAVLVVALLERRRGRVRSGALKPGVTVVTGPWCTLCGPTLAALEARGISPTVYDLSRAPDGLGTVMSLPTVYVVGDDGEVVIRRSGRSALTDVDAIAQVAGAG